MKSIYFTFTLILALLPSAYSQTAGKRPTAQKQTGIQPAGTPNTLAENSASGSLTFNGKTVALSYVYVKSGAVNYNPGVHLFFTDRPIVQAVAEEGFQMKARDGEVNGIYVRMDEAAKRVLGYEIGINKEYLFVYNYDYSRAQGEAFSGEVFNLTTPTSGLLQGTISANRTTKRIDVARSTIQEERYVQYVYQFNLNFKAGLKKDAWTGNFGVYPPVTLEAGRAEGVLIDKGQKKQLNYVRAIRKSAGFKEEFVLTLIFTEQPLLQSSPSKEHTPYLQIRINPKKMTVDGVDTMRANGNESFASSAMINNFVIRNGNILEGRFTFAGNYNVACRALIEEAPVEKPVVEPDRDPPVTARTGKPLPAGGGEPGRIYVQYLTALGNAKTFEEVMRVIGAGKASTTDEAQRLNAAKGLTDKEKKEFMEIMETFGVVQNIRIAGGFINKDRATLAITGVTKLFPVKGEVNMHLEGGQWKVGNEALLPSGKNQ